MTLQETQSETGNALFSISDGVSGLIMNFESLPSGYLFPWKKMDAFNLVCMGLASPSSSCILLNLSTIYQKVLLRTWYGK